MVVGFLRQSELLTGSSVVDPCSKALRLLYRGIAKPWVQQHVIKYCIYMCGKYLEVHFWRRC
jgi:hypothetical protein